VSGEKAIRVAATMAVMIVALIAAIVSFVHIEHLAVTHGQTRLASVMLPVSVDGTVGAASLVLLHEARAGRSAPWLARCMLVLGVAATLACNIGYGAPYGLTGELLSGWPAVAFVGSVEMVLAMIRRSRVPGPQAVPAASNGHDAAVRQFAPWLERGELPGVKVIKRELSVGQAKAQQVRDRLQQVIGTR
jgi:Protein of unknown function (DUF2637)